MRKKFTSIILIVMLLLVFTSCRRTENLTEIYSITGEQLTSELLQVLKAIKANYDPFIKQLEPILKKAESGVTEEEFKTTVEEVKKSLSELDVATMEKDLEPLKEILKDSKLHYSTTINEDSCKQRPKL